MRQETKLIKNLLCHYFPCVKFNVRFVKAKQYYYTSDKIIVSVPSDIEKECVRILCQNTKDIRIIRKGLQASISGVTHPRIFDVEKECYADADMLEFIEIQTT